MEPLATTDQLAEWMQTDPQSLPASAEAVLGMVSDIVRAEARSTFTRSTSTATLYPVPVGAFPDPWRVDLPKRPVVSVDSVTRDGKPVTYRLVRDSLYVQGCEPVSVTFTAGYDPVPGDVLAVVLSAAQRVLSNPLDLRQETVGSISVTYASETIGASLSPADRNLLAKYRRTATVVTEA